MLAADVIAQLMGPTVSAGSALIAPGKGPRAGRGGAPPVPGLFSWWMSPGALPGIVGTSHPSESIELLHVGSAPTGPESKTTLRSCLVDHHLGVVNSTSAFRFSLAALLHEQQGWAPVLRGTAPALTAGDDALLTAWMRKKLRLRWCVHPEPWTVEADVVGALSLALVRASNKVARARKTFRMNAKRPTLSFQPPGGVYLLGFDVHATPMTRNVATRRRESVATWLAAISTAATAAAATVEWSSSWRYGAVVEIRIPWDADIDNYLKDTLDGCHRAGIFAGDDKRVDLVHGIKRTGVPAAEAGARVEVWRL